MLNFLKKLFNFEKEKSFTLSETPKIKKHDTGIISQQLICPECKSFAVKRYAKFIQITENVIANCCECDNCGAEFVYLPKEYWEVSKVKHQLEAWRI